VLGFSKGYGESKFDIQLTIAYLCASKIKEKPQKKEETMARKVNARQVLITLHKYFGVDMFDFRYRFISGRITGDYAVMESMRCNTLAEAFDALKEYFRYDYKFMEGVPVEELIEKKYITKTSIRLAKKVRDVYQGR
jgi:hypothetical protein